MRIQRVEVRNFRALRNSDFNLGGATALLGENNSGKSAFLLALDLFFSSSPRVGPKDFSDENIGAPIDITVHFAELTPGELEEFGGNLLNGRLVVTRRFYADNPAESGKFFVSALVNPDFIAIRNESGKTDKRKLYAELRQAYGNPPELLKEKSADEIDGFLEAWEAAHPESLELHKVAAFKGWTNVAAGKLKQKTSFVLIRAVQDAAEDIQGNKASPVRNLLDTIARQTIENSAAFKAFLDEANQKISDITNPANVPVLAEISQGMTRILSDYYKDSEIITTWQPVTQLQPSFPMAAISVKDNDFITGLEGVGHGLQRAVILTVLQYMAAHTAKEQAGQQQFDTPQSDLILAIEEPEIYQHPTKQRLFGKILRRLAEGFNAETGIRVQTIFVTHSPLLVSLPACEAIRMVRRVKEGEARNVRVSETSLEACSLASAQAAGRPPEEAWSATRYAAKLHTFDTQIAEGFFSRCVVLVEGVGDQSVLEAWYRLKGRDPHAEGIVIAQVSGKNNIQRPVVIFSALAIPCFWLFDNDRSDNTKDEKERIATNSVLQRLAGVADDQCAEWPEGCFERFACWDANLEAYVRFRAGDELFQKLKGELAQQFDIEGKSCLKFPATAAALLERLTTEGVQFPELDQVLAAVDALISGPPAAGGA